MNKETKKINKLLRDKNWTQAELTRKLQRIEANCSTSLVSAWCLGKCVPGFRYMKAINKVAGKRLLGF